MQYDFNVGAGQAQTIEVSGSYFRYKGGIGPIRVIASSGGYVDLMPGQGMRSVKFDRLTIKDMSGANNQGFILAGEGDWVDERISGAVEVIDGGKASTLAGVAFSAWVSAPGSAGVRSVVQLQNPAGSGKNVVVEGLAVASQSGTGFEVRPGLLDVGGGFGTAASKYVTSGALAVSSAVFKVGTRAVDTTATLYLLNAAVGTQAVWRPLRPIVIAPGGILTVVGQALNADVAVSMEWYETLVANG